MIGVVVVVRARCSSCAGQSSVELLGLLPLIAVITLAAAQLLAAGLTRTAASSAAEAAAMALLQGQDPATAARAATPEWTHRHLTVRVDGRRVHIRITPPAIVPGTAGLLAAEAEADAGPKAAALTTAPRASRARAGVAASITTALRASHGAAGADPSIAAAPRAT